MKKQTLVFILLVAAVCTVGARDLADLFILREGAVNSVFPYLDYNARMDMVDYRKAGMASATKDVMYNQPIAMDTLNNDYLRLSTNGMTIDVAMLAQGVDTLIVVAPTLQSGFSGESSIEVYDTDWRPVRGAFVEPIYNDWLVKDWNKTTDIGPLVNEIVCVSYTVDIDPATATITLTNRPLQVPGLNPEFVKYFKPTLVYKMQNRKLKPVK